MEIVFGWSLDPLLTAIGRGSPRYLPTLGLRSIKTDVTGGTKGAYKLIMVDN